MRALLLITTLSLAASPALADGTVQERGGLLGAGLMVGAKLELGVPSPFNELVAHPAGELELGASLPWLGRSLAVVGGVRYGRPSSEGETAPDPRLPEGGAARYRLVQDQLVLSLGLQYRLRLETPWLRPYASLGARLLLLRTRIDGSAGGQGFGENEETATRGGLYGALGLELFVGPGAVVAEARLDQASLDGFVLRRTNVSALAFALGYRIFI